MTVPEDTGRRMAAAMRHFHDAEKHIKHYPDKPQEAVAPLVRCINELLTVFTALIREEAKR